MWKNEKRNHNQDQKPCFSPYPLLLWRTRVSPVMMVGGSGVGVALLSRYLLVDLSFPVPSRTTLSSCLARAAMTQEPSRYQHRTKIYHVRSVPGTGQLA